MLGTLTEEANLLVTHTNGEVVEAVGVVENVWPCWILCTVYNSLELSSNRLRLTYNDGFEL